MAENISFETPDLIVEFPESTGGSFSLKGYGIMGNQDIITNKKIERYGELMWVSLGNPSIAYSPTPTDAAAKKTNEQSIYPEMFLFSDDGFTVKIATLSEAHREKLVEVVKSKYDIKINASKIVNMQLKSLECRLDFYTIDGLKRNIFGKAKNLDVYPLVVSFNAPVKSELREEFESKLRSCMNEGKGINEIDLPIECVMKSGALTTKTNYFSISSHQMNAFGIKNEVFGPASEVFVTRGQMESLASKLHSSMRIYEEYQTPTDSFKETFVEEMIRQVATESFKYVSLEEAAHALSPYDFSQDLKPDVMRKDLGKVIKIEKSDGKEHIVVNKSDENQGSKKTSNNFKATGSGETTFKIVKINATLDFVRKNKNKWDIKNTSLEDQLHELNTNSENQIEWEREGEWLVPKSFKLMRLSKAVFEKGLNFERINRVIMEEPFKKEITLNTLRDLRCVDIFSKLLSRQKRLIELMGRLTGTFDYLSRAQIHSVLNSIEDIPLRDNIKELLKYFSRELTAAQNDFD